MDTTCIEGHRGTQLQTEVTSVCAVQVGHKPGVRVTSSGPTKTTARESPSGTQQDTTPVYEGESTVWSNQRGVRQGAQNSVPSPKIKRETTGRKVAE